ncbi:MAG: SLC13 family permease, partial [Candidatus Longimicrobiales bacterium M2_2A_002]
SMTVEAWITLATLVGVLAVMATDRFSPSLTLLVGVIFLMVMGIVTPSQAFSGFSNPAPITVAALFILAAATEKTGALQPVIRWVLGRSRGRRRSLARVTISTLGASAFLNNTPIVAMLSPQVSQWTEREGYAPSRFLMPLSFASILGGMVTLIGTSTNLVVSGLLEASGREPLGMFELTPYGLPVAFLGMVLILVLAPILLPDRRGPLQQDAEELRQFVVNMEVVRDGPLDGQTIEEAGLRRLTGLFLAEIVRDGLPITPVSPRTTLRGGDRLTLVGRAEDVVELHKNRGLVSAESDQLDFFDDPDHTFFEAVIGEGSPLVGQTLKEVGFRGVYQAAVVAIHRSGERVADKLGRVPLKLGDTLILLSDSRFATRWKGRRDFLLVARLGGSAPSMSRKAPVVGVVGLAIVLSAALGVTSILNASLLGVLALLGLRILTPEEARAAVNLEVIVVIAAAFGLAAAIQASGLAAIVADGMVSGLGGIGPTPALLGILLTTVILTEVITNNAAAALVFPIALATAEGVGADPRLFAIALAIVASASFLTPIGYQTNTMVYGPGGYRFTDYARLGTPLTLTVVAAVTVLVSLAL